MNSDLKDPTIGTVGWLTGQLLVAMPAMLDPRFERTVVLICSHGPEGAMGLVLNRMFGELDFAGLLAQFNLKLTPGVPELPVYYGGPVEPVRGFVLHSSDYQKESTTVITPSVNLTATVEILSSLAEGKGPDRALLVLGYAGWAPGQLEIEIQNNGWLTVPADDDLVFDGDIEVKWSRALGKIGVSPMMLSADFGHA
ncbi:MAG: YqgE/AlgH family protein [Alphaproteobacteria bacterium]|nr:YqgE/AlgH family protein [Alphaproteobacteria bacterium]